MGNMTTLQILQGIKTWVTTKLNLKQDVINDLANIRSGAQAGSTAVQPAELSAYFNDASYDSNAHRINFYHGQTVVAYIDASPFIIDGMVDDVRIENGYLVIDFNTASGKQDISIPLTDIFNPNNYYNKTQTDGLLAQKQDVIQDLSTIRSGASAGATAVQPSTLNSALSDTVAESGVYDVTANNNNAKFASLSALLNSENLDTLIPSAKRKGGMSIKFVQSSDNKYVQYRYIGTSTTNANFTTISNWQNTDFRKDIKLLNTFEIGNIGGLNSNIWTYSNSTTRIRTKEGTYLYLKTGDVIRCSDYSSIRMYIGCKDDYTKGTGGWLTRDFVVQYDGEYVVLASNLVEQDVTVDVLGSKFTLIKALGDSAYCSVDEEPTPNSKNLVESGGVKEKLNELHQTMGTFSPFSEQPEADGVITGYINNYGIISNYDSASTFRTKYWQIRKGVVYKIINTYASGSYSIYAIYDVVPEVGVSPVFYVPYNGDSEVEFVSDYDGYVASSATNTQLQKVSLIAHQKTKEYLNYESYLTEDNRDGLASIADISLNVYNPEYEVLHYSAATGEPFYAANHKYNAEYIPIKKGQYVVFKPTTNATSFDGIDCIMFYDTQKQYLTNYRINGEQVVNYKVENNASYIRFDVGINATDIMVLITDEDRGFTSLQYVPYGNKIKIESLPDEALGNLPKYLETSVVSTIKKAVSAKGQLTFLWQSDQHIAYDLGIISQIKLATKLSKCGTLDMLVLGGDIIDGAVTVDGTVQHKDAVMDYLIECSKYATGGSTDVIMLKGNHEDNFIGVGAYGAGQCFQNSELYHAFMKRLPNKAVFNEEEDYPLYFYLDFDKQKIRCVFLNTSDNVADNGDTYGDLADQHIRQKQLNWIFNTALDFSDKSDRSEWAVLTIGHGGLWCSEAFAVSEAPYIKNLIKAFIQGTAATVQANIGEWNEIDISVDYTSQGAMEYIGHLQGHGHRDGVLTSYGVKALTIYEVNSYPQKVSLPSGLASAGFEVYDRTIGTVSEQALDIINIDRTTNRLNMTRLGAGGSRIIHYVPIVKSVGEQLTLTTEVTGTVTWMAFGSAVTVNNGTVTCNSATNTMALIRAENENYDKEYWAISVVNA